LFQSQFIGTHLQQPSEPLCVICSESKQQFRQQRDARQHFQSDQLDATAESFPGWLGFAESWFCCPVKDRGWLEALPKTVCLPPRILARPDALDWSGSVLPRHRGLQPQAEAAAAE